MYKKILLVGFNYSNTKTLIDDLDDYYDIDAADNYEEAAKYLMMEYRLIKLVLVSSDIFRQNKYHLISSIRENVLLKSIPVICIGNFFDKNTARLEEEEAIAHGAIDYFAMPVNTKFICKRLERIIKAEECAAYPQITFCNPLGSDSMIRMLDKAHG